MASDFDSMSIDELWTLHEELAAKLAARLNSEKIMLETRLRQLAQTRPAEGKGKLARREEEHERRPYPTVVPKYRNPDNSSETWSGRGKQPRWLTAKLEAGKPIDDFSIDPKATHRRANVTVIGS
jgi:DNA-binding protein H-NS